ncbi:RNA-directed DNA polymerase, eukaryota [Tanacetum coccineum]
MLNEIGQVNIEVNEDTCSNGTFTVKEARNLIDQKTLPSLAPSTTWDKTIPRKVNIFMWRLLLDRLPHRLNISLRGMDIPAISCSSCNDGAKSPLSKLYLLRRLKIGSTLGMLLKKRNTGFTSFLLRFFGGFGNSRQFDLILDRLAEVPFNDRVLGPRADVQAATSITDSNEIMFARLISVQDKQGCQSRLIYP